MKFTTVRVPETAARQLKKLAKKYDVNQGKMVAALVARATGKPVSEWVWTEVPAVPDNLHPYFKQSS